MMGLTQSIKLFGKLLGVILFTFAVSTPVWAGMQKFVYIFDANGSLLTPNNAATECPSPLDNLIGDTCHGVKVAADGTYSIELPTDSISDPDKLALVSKTYEFIGANTNPGVKKDTYIETKSKRRLEKVKPNQHNKGVDINALSEAAVKAVEEEFDIEIGSEEEQSLEELGPDFDADLINEALGNGKSDNNTDDITDTDQLGLKESNLNLLDEDDETTLVELAKLAIENQDNAAALSAIRKNVSQSLVNSELFDETTDRILSQVAEIIAGAPGDAVMMLDADRYVAHIDEVVNLTTDNAINAASFFGYTWLGVESDTSKATFSRSEPGSYLVCVTGEINNANDSSSDCVRIEVKPITYAVITAHPTRLPTNDTVHLSGFYSVGAQSYRWTSDNGQFANDNTMETTWTTPAVKGTYEITLTINDDEQDTVNIEVYDVLPVAIATTNKHELFIEEGATAVLTSSSISTDGSAVDSIEWSIIEKPTDSLPTLSNTNLPVANFNSVSLGDYVIRHTAIKDGISDSVNIKLQLRQRGVPVADAGADINTFRNTSVRLNGSNSHDLDGLPLSHLWSSDGGNLTNTNNAVANLSSDALGTFTASLTVNNGSQSASDDAIITVRNRLPLASDDFYDPDLGEISVGSLHAFDSDGDPLTYTLLTEPDNGGVTIDPSGVFVYEPGGSKGCKYHPDHKPYDNLKGGKDVPVLKLCADKFVVSVGETVNLTVSNSINATKHQGYEWMGAEGIDDRNATFVATVDNDYQVCITGGIGNSNNTSTACTTITVKPGQTNSDDNPSTVSDGFVDSFQYLVNDGYGNSNIATVVLKVGWENTPPVVDDLSLTTNEEVAVSGILTANDVDNQLLILSVAEQGSKGTLTINDAATGDFTYTPNVNAFGTDTVKVAAYDGHDNSALGTVTITINGSNDVPVTFNSNLSTLEDTPLLGAQLSANEPDGEALTYTLMSNGTIGTAVLTDAVNGIITYSPNANNKGHDSFTFRVSDGKDNSNTATVNITVESVNDAPVAHDLDRIFTIEDQAFSNTLDAEDIDLDSLTYRLLNTGTLGTAVITNSDTGAFTFTPNQGVNGSDTISYVANDGSVDSNIAFVPITISPNEAPVAADMAISTDHITTIEDTLSATDAEGQDLTYEIVSNGSKGTVQLLDLGTGAFRYTPNGQLGTDTFTYLARDNKSPSEVATVTVTITEFNNAPVANASSFTAFEGVPYTNYLTGSDVENSTLTFAIVNNGHMGSAGFDNASTGLFSYTSLNGRSSEDNFTFTVSDGDKTSAAATVNAHVISTQEACRGPEAPGFDTDGDGYADVVEIAFGTNINDDTETPAGLNPDDYGVDFTTDSDNDGFADNVELWLGTNHNSDSSIPTDSLNKAVPACVNGGKDSFAPALLAFDILTPVVTISGSTDVASFALTAMDNSGGVKDITVLLRSPSGQEVKATASRDSAEIMLYLEFDSEYFSQYAEAGTWTVAELELVDAAGNERIFGTADLLEREFPTEVEVINSNSDITAADLLGFVILTPTVDLADADPKASFTVSASDSPAGIKRITVTLRSPTGTSFRWAEMFDSNHATSFNGQIDSNSFDNYAETGTWTVSELAIIDAASNTLSLSTAQLTGLGFDTTVEVINGLADTDLPLLDDFQILTPKVYPAPGDAKAKYSVTASDAKSGVNSIEVMLVSPTGSESMQAVFTSPSMPASIQTEMTTGFFTTIAEAGVWEVSYVVVTDGANNRATFSTSDLTAAGYDTTVHVIYLGGGINTPPVAYGDHIVLDEDTTYNGQLSSFDADGHAVTYHLDTAPENGSVSIDANTGAYAYTPSANYFGSDSFSFKVDDGYSESNSATVSITVNPVNDAPTSEDFAITVTANTTYTGTIEATDVDGDVLTFAIVSNGTRGSASITDLNAGEYQYVPNTDVLGNDTFTFTVSDGTETAGPYTVSVSIEPDLWVVDFEVLTPVVTNKDSSVTVTCEVTFNKPASAFSTVGIQLFGPSGQVIPFSKTVGGQTSGPIQLSIVVDTNAVNFEAGSWIYRNLLAQETNKATVMVEDDLIGAGFDATVQVVDNVLPVADDAAITVQKNMPFFGTLSANDPDNDPLTYLLVGAPELGSVDIEASSGAFTYTPPAHTTGTDSFTFKVNDGFNDSNIATVSISIIEPNGVPVAYNSSITVFRNLAYGGNLLGFDSDGDTLSYHLVNNGSLGNVSINSSTGVYVYTPTANLIGNDSFTFYVSDGSNQSAVATVDITILHEDQICHYGDSTPGDDDDGDGYANVVEVAFGTDINDDSSTPEGLSADDLGVSFTDDDDNDGFPDYVEIWLGSDPNVGSEKPTDSTLGHLPPCFDSGSDGIKPRLLAFDISTPIVDISGGNGFASYNMTLIDNASGVRRVRIDLLSPSGAFHTTSTSFDDYPLVRGISLDSNTFSSFAEQGIWQISGITIYDEAGNKRSINTAEMVEAGFPTDVDLRNVNSDNTAPSLDGFTVLTPSVNAVNGDAILSFQVDSSDDIAGINSVVITLASPGGVNIEAVGTFSDTTPTDLLVQIDTSTLSGFAEQGAWTITSLLLTDAAGNTAQYADQLAGLGYDTSVSVTNTGGDGVKPTSQGFTILTPEVFPAGGNARMSFMVSALDDVAGIEKIRIDLQGPNGQYLAAWGYFFDTTPLYASDQINTAVLSTLLQEGAWTITEVEIYDVAGNSSRIDTDELISNGYATTVTVSY